MQTLTRRLAPGLLACFAAVWCGLIASEARAAPSQYGIVTLDLRPTSGQVPTHLCVLSEAPSARARQTLATLLESDTTEPQQEGLASARWRVVPSVWGGDEQTTDALRCGDDPVTDCRPRIELPPGLSPQTLHVACTADSLVQATAATDPRPLFILLEYLEGSPPQIESVRLAGGVATIGVLRSNFDRVIVTARSVGGSYLEHERSERGIEEDSGQETLQNKYVQLALEPRCQVVEVRLPKTVVGPSDRQRLHVRVHGKTIDVDKCVSHLVGRDVIQVRLPKAPLAVGSIDIELEGRTSGSAGAHFGGDFEGAWPRSPFALRLNQVTFSWHRPECIYPRDRCPSATLETGTVCSAEVTERGCDYRCPGKVSGDGAMDLDLELPLEVTFERQEPHQRWTDKLAANGQTLTSYVPSDQIYLGANINHWVTNVPDNNIKAIEIFGEDGEARRYGVTRVDSLRLKVPGASCQSLRFRPVGDRAYDEVVATVDDGQIDFGDPQRSARRVSFNFTIAAGGGPAWSGDTATPPLYFSALGMFAMEARPRRAGWQRLGFEIRAGVTLGHWGEILRSSGEEEPGDGEDVEEPAPAPATTTTTTRGSVDRFGWARVLFEPGLVVSVHDRIAVGGGFGLGFSVPFRRREVTRQDINFIWSPSLDLRFRLRRWLRLVVQFRGIFGERAFVVQGDLPEGDTARSLLTLVGLQVLF